MHSVLVVDDDQALRKTVASWIDSFGYKVQEATTRRGRLERDGARAQQHRAVRRQHGRTRTASGWRGGCASVIRRPPIILATALRDCETAVSSLRNDVVDYLLKPFDRIRLLEALSLGRDWHAAAAGADELHQALQDRLRTPARRRWPPRWPRRRPTHSAALDGLISMLQFHERDGRGHSPPRGAAHARPRRRARRRRRRRRSCSSNMARCCTTSASSTCPRQSSPSRRRSTTRNGT